MLAVDKQTGKELWKVLQDEPIDAEMAYTAVPIVAGDKLDSTAGDGVISVVKLGEKPELLATNEMRYVVYATPAIVDGIIYARTHSAV